MTKSILYIVSLPIGNVSDISLRALSVLNKADVIVCENVGQTTALLRHLGILHQTYPKSQPTKDKIQQLSRQLLKTLLPLIERQDKPHFIAYESYQNSAHLVQEVINRMKEKKIIVALVSTAGTPLISDPGLDLVRAAHEENFEVHPIPGPSAVLSSLVVSGFNPHYYAFLGMLPKNSTQRRQLLLDWSRGEIRKTTAIAYVSKYQLIPTLQDMLKVLGDTEIFLANDLTKLNEQGYKGKITHLIKYFQERNIKGEWVIVFTLSSANDK